VKSFDGNEGTDRGVRPLVSSLGTSRDMTADLDHRHRDTLEKLFSRPSSANIEWRQVLSLLEAVGTTQEEHNGKLKVTLGSETEVFEPPRSKDIDQQMAVDLRRMLANAGYAPDD
jgi:hypothetical protein